METNNDNQGLLSNIQCLHDIELVWIQISSPQLEVACTIYEDDFARFCTQTTLEYEGSYLHHADFRKRHEYFGSAHFEFV